MARDRLHMWPVVTTAEVVLSFLGVGGGAARAGPKDRKVRSLQQVEVVRSDVA